MADYRRRLHEQLTGTYGLIDGKLQGLVYPIWRVRPHPAVNLLLQYAFVRCQVLVGRAWTPDEMQAAVTKDPNSSEFEDDSISQIKVDEREKSTQGFVTIVRWDDIKQNPQ